MANRKFAPPSVEEPLVEFDWAKHIAELFKQKLLDKRHKNALDTGMEAIFKDPAKYTPLFMEIARVYKDKHPQREQFESSQAANRKVEVGDPDYAPEPTFPSPEVIERNETKIADFLKKPRNLQSFTLTHTFTSSKELSYVEQFNYVPFSEKAMMVNCELLFADNKSRFTVRARAFKKTEDDDTELIFMPIGETFCRVDKDDKTSTEICFAELPPHATNYMYRMDSSMADMYDMADLPVWQLMEEIATSSVGKLIDTFRAKGGSSWQIELPVSNPLVQLMRYPDFWQVVSGTMMLPYVRLLQDTQVEVDEHGYETFVVLPTVGLLMLYRHIKTTSVMNRVFDPLDFMGVQIINARPEMFLKTMAGRNIGWEIGEVENAENKRSNISLQVKYTFLPLSVYQTLKNTLE